MTENRLRVELGERSYDILAGPGLIGRAGSLMAPLLERPRVFVITDANVAPLYLDRLSQSLSQAGIAFDAHILPAGEATKDFAHLESLLDVLLAAKAERLTTLIALGGGVIGDLVGFAAAILLRGVPFIQIPTTLLAQVDSSVGGKTGINTKRGKNLVGAFYQPRLVLADSDALATLPKRELLAGYAEVLKYGLIDDAPFFSWLEAHHADVLALKPPAILHAVLTSCRAKARIVGLDEREAGLRALLNLGHTFGHVLEAEVGYDGRMLHGEAVALGMQMAFDLSVRMTLAPKEDASRLAAHLAAVGLPVRLPKLAGLDWKAERLLAHMTQDKKVKDGKVTFVLAKGIGRAFLEREVTEQAVRALMQDAVGMVGS
ncbi:MAG: 3-dehydroquinate synthase [Alphaproteobacteria bacterium]|nr:3-dehydroquinate synthase [Alphaproteobacteria bacterium]